MLCDLRLNRGLVPVPLLGHRTADPVPMALETGRSWLGENLCIASKAFIHRMVGVMGWVLRVGNCRAIGAQASGVNPVQGKPDLGALNAQTARSARKRGDTHLVHTGVSLLQSMGAGGIPDTALCPPPSPRPLSGDTMKLKQTVVAATLMCACAGAFAQAAATSSVTLYGTIDQYINYMSSSSGAKIKSVNDGAFLRSRFGRTTATPKMNRYQAWAKRSHSGSSTPTAEPSSGPRK